MIALPGYQVIEKIYESANSLVYRGLREQVHQPVILKLLKAEYPSPAEIARYQLEYEITHNINLPGVVKAYSLGKYKNSLIAILEDFGGQSLKILIDSQKFSLTEFLQIAIQITDILGQIHAANIIHKDINPSNIVLNPSTGQVKIIDFGISTVLSRENFTLKNPNFLEGTLLYMSPEQTGRMNRAIDYRTDFYSLGVSFYELLTNKLPFETSDALELIHCHIAKQPIPPQELQPEIPQALANIVIKLLAKTAEDRYQSAWGIKADLERCLNEWQTNNQIENFPLGSQDISDKFQIPQKLYGRDAEIQTLLAAFARVASPQEIGASQSKSEMMLVSGYSGIGKSALVQEIYKPITRQKGYFISGKFDQFQRNIPYSSLIQAFQELISQLLTESTSQIALWRDEILAALGSNSQVIIDVIPELELIVGKQPPLPELAPTESQNRFNLTLQNFISVFTKPTHPLVIFLDDLQWADLPSLKLIELLIGQSDSQYLLLIGAYRDNEVSAAHPLRLTIEEIQKAGAVVNHLFLKPLKLPIVNRLIADTLNCEIARATPLAELVFQKTNGNPFFLNEFLKSLYTENLLNFDVHLGSWQWVIEQIAAAPIAANVVELMAAKIQKLSEDTQQVLKLAACIGNQFDLNTLAIVNQKSLNQTADQLWEAVKEGLIFPLGNEYKLLAAEGISKDLKVIYKFLHDRVQQAAYSLIPEVRQQAVHLEIGQMLLNNTPQEIVDERIFDIVNHLNAGRELLENQSERDRLAELNLIAGKKAKASTAYQSAFTYLTLGLELLPVNRWQVQYEITLTLSIEAAEAAYLSGQFEQIEKLISAVLENAIQLLDKVKIYEVKIAACMAQNQILAAIDTGLTVLKLLGINIPPKATNLDILMNLIATKLTLMGKQVASLNNLPAMTDKNKFAATRIMGSIASAVYIAAPNLATINCLQGVKLAVQYGNFSLAPVLYASYGVILCTALEDIDTGFQFGQLALSLLQQLDAQKIRAKTVYIVNAFIIHCVQHARETLPSFLNNYHYSIEAGDLEYAAYSANLYCYYSYHVGQELAVVEKEAAKYSDAMQKIKQERKFYGINLSRQIVLNLMGNSDRPWILIGDAYDESKRLPIDIQIKDYYGIFNLYVNKSILCYLFGDYQQAVENANLAGKYVKSAIGVLTIPVFYFYDSLIGLAIYPNASKSAQKRLLKKIQATQKKMQKWAKYAPMNHLHKFYLVEAERYRVLGQEVPAMNCYDRAISLAKENEYINEEALAWELAAKFYLERGREAIAQLYMHNARYGYLRWGAIAKVKDLDTRYPQLSRQVEISQPNIKNTQIATSRTTSGRNNSEVLDITTVIKASQALSGEIVFNKLLANLMRILIENAGAQTGFLILENQGQLLIEAEGGIEPDSVKVLNSIPLESSQLIASTIVNYVVRTKESVVLNNATSEGKFTKDDYIQKHQPKSLLCTPLINQGKLISIVYLENNLTPGAFTPDRLEVLKLLSSQAAISIENARLYTQLEDYNRTLEQKVVERTAELADANQEITLLNQRLKAENLRMTTELDVTRRLQQMILPKEQELSQIAGLEIAGFMEPANEVGGDYYDILPQADGVKIGIGDVTGHGLESGMLMIMAQTAVRTLLESNETNPVKFLDILNRTLYKNVSRMNSDKSMSLVLLDYSQGTIVISGQHEEVIIVRANGEIELIDTLDLGFPIGLESDVADFIAQTQVQLNSGDGLVLYTDGITEAANLAQEEYGLKRLCNVVRHSWYNSVQEIRQAVIEDVRRHIGEQKVFDDITLVVLKQV